MRSKLESVRLKSFFEIGALGVALVFTQTGCPGGADLEQPDSYAGRFSTGGTGTGGSGTGGSGTGGTAPIAGTGTGATAGSGTAGSGTAGTAGTGGGAFDITTFTCTGSSPVTVFKKCASVGCHNTASMQSGLVLTPDASFASRVKDVPAKHGGISCAPDGQPFMECTTPPAGCPSNAKLVDSANPQASWILGKIGLMDNQTCGEPMPYTYTLADADKACIQAVVQAIASSQ